MSSFYSKQGAEVAIGAGNGVARAFKFPLHANHRFFCHLDALDLSSTWTHARE
jgi:hypothetical protein